MISAAAQEHGSTPATAMLRVQAAHGSIRVTGKPGAQQIDWSMQMHGHAQREGERPEISVTTAHGVTEFVTSAAANLEITVPTSLTRLTVETGEGDLEADHISGAVTLETDGGRLSADEVGGRLLLKTGGGNISIRRNGSPAHCETGGGNVDIDAAGADVFVETGGGYINVTALKGSGRLETGGGNISVHQATGTLLLQTSGGNIELGNIGGDVRAETGGGEIRLASAGGTVQAKTGSGLLECKNLMRALMAETGSGHIIAEYAREMKTMATSHLQTGSGDITVSMPEQVAVNVHAVSGTGWGHRIQSEFSGIHTRPAHGNDNLTAEGQLNGGGASLMVETGNGDISFLRTH